MISKTIGYNGVHNIFRHTQIPCCQDFMGSPTLNAMLILHGFGYRTPQAELGLLGPCQTIKLQRSTKNVGHWSWVTWLRPKKWGRKWPECTLENMAILLGKWWQSAARLRLENVPNCWTATKFLRFGGFPQISTIVFWFFPWWRLGIP